MKRNVVAIGVLSIVFLLGACAGGGGMKVVSSPHSELQLEANQLVKDGGLAFVGTGISTREDIARKKAQTAGRTGLAQALESKVKSYEKQFQEEIGTSGESEINEAFQTVSEQLSKTVLVGVLPVREIITKDEGTYTIYTIMAVDPKTFIQSFQDQMKEQKALYTRYRQSKMHNEMEKKLEDYDKF
jgi:ribosomal protein S20